MPASVKSTERTVYTVIQISTELVMSEGHSVADSR